MQPAISQRAQPAPQTDTRPYVKATGVLSAYHDFPAYYGNIMRAEYNPFLTGLGFIHDETGHIGGLVMVESLYDQMPRQGSSKPVLVTNEVRRQAYLAISDYLLDKITTGDHGKIEFNNHFKDGVGHIEMRGHLRAVHTLVVEAINVVGCAMFDGRLQVDFSQLTGSPYKWGNSLQAMLGFADYVITRDMAARTAKGDMRFGPERPRPRTSAALLSIEAAGPQTA